MKLKNCSIFFFILIIFSFHVTSSQSEEFEYDEKSEKGPSKWGDLRKEWEACKTGMIQSPINLFPQRIIIVGTQQQLKVDYKPTNTTLEHSGYDISLRWVFGEAGSIKINGTEFFLQGVHWHIPSEHTINGIRYNMEMHMVHKSSDEKKIAVIGVLYELGFSDPFLHQLMKMTNVSEIEVGGSKDVGIVNPNINGERSQPYYRYIGSLTTPPCTEGVIWTIMHKVRSVSYKQIEILQEAVLKHARMNARPIQPLNGRDVILYI